jgi:hypothetical protein
MKRNHGRRLGMTVLAPVFAVWALLGMAGATRAEQPDNDAMEQRYREETLRVNVWVDKDDDDVYRKGEPIAVTFQTGDDAYAVVYHIDTDGRVEILWPTTRYSDGFAFGGHRYKLPSREAGRLRAAESEGVGYIEAVVSRYPFDLRDLEIDFLHERADGRHYAYYVAGDPFLAMNEVNFAVTGLDDASGYVVTNYASYYVHRPVDHPRYLCLQCHDDGRDPYDSSCTVTITYDYGWANDWWGAYGFYPAYYYPVYYYADPWSGVFWVNYWYDPWYHWPYHSGWHWRHHCYDWRYSPYWHGNANRPPGGGGAVARYQPLDRSRLGRDADDVVVRTKNTLVTDARPADDRISRMRDRVVSDRRDPVRVGDDAVARDEGRPGGGDTRNVAPVSRSQRSYEPATRIRTQPGLRVPVTTTDRDRTASPDATRQADSRRTGNTRPTVRSIDTSRDGDDRAIRPVEPRRDSGRVWSNRRNTTGGSSTRPTSPPTRVTRPDSRQSRPDRSQAVKPASPRTRPNKPAAPAKPPARRDSGQSKPRVQQKAPKAPAQPSPPPPARSGGNTRSSGGETGTQKSGGRR